MNLFSAAPVPASPFSEQEKFSWLRLARSAQIGPVTFHKLLERYGSAVSALEHFSDLSRRGGRSKPLHPCPVQQVEEELHAIERFGAKLICAGEPLYPLSLSVLPDAPPVLTLKGRMDLLNQPGLGIVGARNASLNGRKFAEKLAGELGEGGQIIISGMARGVDTSAHKGALSTGTIAVIAGGIDVVYPEENRALYEEICKVGLVVAESPFGVAPVSQSFPRRNRIISGLSQGVIVVEATLRSGSLITARLAAEQGRDVYAVPGFPLDPRAEGPNKLIQEGAALITSAQDILSAQQDFVSRIPRGVSDPKVETDFASYEEDERITGEARDLILAKLSAMPVQLDDLIRDLDLSPAAVNSALLELELAARIQRSPGGRVSLIS